MDRGPHYWETVNLLARQLGAMHRREASNLPVNLTDLIAVVLLYSHHT